MRLGCAVADRDHGGLADQVGPLIKHYRTRRGLTQRELAAVAGVSIGTLRDLEQGRTRWPRWLVVEKVTAALGMDQRQRAGLMRSGRPAPVRMAVLGPVTVWLDDATVDLGSVRQCAVLGLLALNYGAGVHRDAVIDVLWGARPPSSAVGQVHGYVSRLRKLLGGREGTGGSGKVSEEVSGEVSGEVISTVGTSYYRLQAGSDQLDVAAFRELAGRAGRAGIQGGGPEDACELYDQALAHWRDDVASDVDLLREHPAAVELAHQRSDAIVRYARAALRTATPQRALPQLRQLCQREPFNEDAHAYLMLALAAAGQRAAALETFTSLRRRLTSQLGIHPGPAAVDAHAQILRHGD